MRAPPRHLLPFILCAALAAAGADAQAPTVMGYWREPGGSVIRIAPCDHQLCVEIARVSAGNHPVTDVRNPDPGLRTIIATQHFPLAAFGERSRDGFPPHEGCAPARCGRPSFR